MRKPGRARAAVAAPGVQFALQAVVRPESGGAVLQGHWRIRDDRGGPQPRAFRMNAEFETETSGTETSETGKSHEATTSSGRFPRKEQDHQHR